MATITFGDGTKVNFNGNPTSQDIEEVANNLGINQQGAGSQDTAPVAHQQDNSGAWFPAQQGDNPVQVGLKTIGNLIPSAFNFAKNAVTGIPKTIAAIPGAVSNLNTESQPQTDYVGAFLKQHPENATPNVMNARGQQPNTPSALENFMGVLPKSAGQVAEDTILGPGLKKLIHGDISGAGRQFENDPIGSAAPPVLAALGLAKGVDSAAGTDISGALDSGITKVGSAVTDPIGSAASSAGSAIQNASRSLASHLTGMEPETISQVLQNPEAFTKVAMEQASRGGLAGEVSSKIDQFIQDSKDTGSQYAPIKNDTSTTIKIPTVDVDGLPNTLIDGILKKNGFTIGPNTVDTMGNKGPNINGTIVADADSITRNPADINAIQNFYNNWGNKETLTPKQFLNMRSDLADLSKFDASKSPASADVGKQLYSTFNKELRPQVPGLKDLDAATSDNIKQMKQLKADLIQSDGEGGYRLKDGAINKIANAAGAGKDQLLGRLENLIPGVTKQIQILKAVEDIQKASGIKVGTYTKNIIGGAGLGGALFFHNLPLGVATIAAEIIAHPTNAVKIMRSASSITQEQIAPLINTLKAVGGNLDNLSREASYAQVPNYSNTGADQVNKMLAK